MAGFPQIQLLFIQPVRYFSFLAASFKTTPVRCISPNAKRQRTTHTRSSAFQIEYLNRQQTQNFNANKNGDPKAAAGCAWQCRAATVPGSTVDLGDHKGYRNHRDGSSNDIYLHLAQPHQCASWGHPGRKSPSVQ